MDDAATVAVLRVHRRERGAVALQLARDDALVFGDHEGRYLHPERFTRTFRAEVARCRKAIGDQALPEIRLHDLRHTHATLRSPRASRSGSSASAWATPVRPSRSRSTLT